ncbi:MAG: ABC transporter ATP-binding protein [Actinomycetota bacterium]
MNDAPALEVRGLTKRYGATLAVDDLTFAVPRGSVTGFLGPNGAGKTTTMRVLLGLASPTAGSAFVLGSPYAALTEPLHKVGASLEVTGFHPGRTAIGHLRVVAAQGGLDPARIDHVLAVTGMTEFASRRVGGYSSGMKQRLALSAALLGKPEVLVLDEPANGLDPAGVAWLRGFLRSFAQEGGAVLISSHILAEVAEVADRVVVIDRGRLLRDGPVSELTADGSVVVVRSPQAERLGRALVSEGASVREADGALEVSGLPIERIGELAARDGVVLHELRARTSTLEQAFLSLTEGGPAAGPAAPAMPPAPPPRSDA